MILSRAICKRQNKDKTMKTKYIAPAIELIETEEVMDELFTTSKPTDLTDYTQDPNYEEEDAPGFIGWGDGSNIE